MRKPKRGLAGGHRVFVRLLAPNMLFLLLPLLVGWVLYGKTVREMEKELTASNMNLLRQNKDVLDRRFAEVASIALQLTGDTRIIQFQPVTEPFVGANTYRVLETRKSIYNFNLTNNFIFNTFVVYKNSGLVFKDSSTYGIAEFYEKFRYEGFDVESWKRLVIGTYHQRKVLPARDVEVDGTRRSLVTYIQSLGYPRYPQGAVVVTVDNREIEKLLGSLDLSGGGWAHIIDEEGSIVSSVSPDGTSYRIDRGRLTGKQGTVMMKLGERDMMITYTTSAYNGWIYLVAQPATVVLEKLLYIKRTTWTMAFVFLALGLIAAYLIAYRNSRPWKSILDTIVERTDGDGYFGSDAYRFVRDNVSRLIDSNRDLEKKLKEQAPLLQAALFERLLKGEYVPSPDTDALLRHVGIDTQGRRFVASIVQLRGYDGGLDADTLEELDVKRVMVKELLRQRMPGQAYWHDTAEDQIALLLAFDADGPAEGADPIADVVPDASELIRSKLNVATRFAIGGTYAGLMGVSRSYEEAKRVIEYLTWRNRNGTMRFDELPVENGGYYYPADLEMRLGHLARAGEKDAVETLLGELHQINFEDRRLSVPMLRLFVSEMWGTVVKLLPQLAMDDGAVAEQVQTFSSENASYGSLERQYRMIETTYRRICDFVGEHKKSQNVQLLEDIVSYVHERFAQADLCLDSVADRMNISKGYLSQFFKEQTGVNFSDYLEQLRMNEAKALLAKTDLPVYEIAQRVGYSSSNTFCRAFKRINGVSASVFRQPQPPS
ncbi:helix-turn-helix domain-containing protein [Paenibacillus flagellatus]|nr:helix-turn-helix domain-containing protein [Paenibacillus flagellatus]